MLTVNGNSFNKYPMQKLKQKRKQNEEKEEEGKKTLANIEINW